MSEDLPHTHNALLLIDNCMAVVGKRNNKRGEEGRGSVTVENTPLFPSPIFYYCKCLIWFPKTLELWSPGVESKL